MLNRRRVERTPSFLGATILYNRGLWSTSCIVKNISPHGARLVARDAPTLPDRFELHIAQKKTSYQVLTKWRDGDVIGVEIGALRNETASNDNVPASS